MGPWVSVWGSHRCECSVGGQTWCHITIGVSIVCSTTHHPHPLPPLAGVSSQMTALTLTCGPSSRTLIRRSKWYECEGINPAGILPFAVYVHTCLRSYSRSEGTNFLIWGKDSEYKVDRKCEMCFTEYRPITNCSVLQISGDLHPPEEYQGPL